MQDPTGEAARRRQRQRGAHAVEYAIIFPVFFALLYGTLAYGLIFTMRLGLQHAAEEGARAALRFPVGEIGPGIDPLRLREQEAERVASLQARWLDGLATPVPRAIVCPSGVAGDPCVQSLSSGPPVPAAIDDCLAAPCQVVVTLTYPYESSPVFPSIPGFGLIFPESLQGRSRALLDGRSLQL